MDPAEGLVRCRQALLPPAVMEEEDVQCSRHAGTTASRNEDAASPWGAALISASSPTLGASRRSQLVISCSALTVLMLCGVILAAFNPRALRPADVPSVLTHRGASHRAGLELLSATGKASGTEPEGFSIVVWSASLPDNDEATYCAVRYGKVDSLWDSKLPGTGRQSALVETKVTSPEYRLGMIAVGRAEELEIQVRVYSSGKKLLLAIRKPISDLLANGLKTTSLAARGGGSLNITVSRGGVAPHFRLKDLGVSDCTECHEKLQPIAQARAAKLQDVDLVGPMLVGKAPLPENLQGLWWRTGSGLGGALMSFGGPTSDAGGCSRGYLASVGGKISSSMRVEGDGVSSYAQEKLLRKLLAWLVDIIYEFEFDDAVSPKSAEIHEWSRSVPLPLQWLGSFTMTYEKDGSSEYPGSKVWSRRATILKTPIVKDDLVQVMDATGRKIEPAWTKFVNYMSDASQTGDYPDWMFYKSIHPSPTPGADAFIGEVETDLRNKAVISLVGACIALVLMCMGCVRCCRKCKRVDYGS